MKGYCEICSAEIEIQICCNAFDCGCGGRPTEPPVCSNECYDKFLKRVAEPPKQQTEESDDFPFFHNDELPF